MLNSFVKKYIQRKKYKYQGILLDRTTRIGTDVQIEGPAYLNIDFISDGVSIGKYTYARKCTCVGENVTIGRYCSIAMHVYIGAYPHPTNWLSTHLFQYDTKMFKTQNKEIPFSQKKVHTTIGNDVWIGTNAIIKSGVTIGDGAIIGAGSIVTKDIPAYAIAGGNPAKIIRYRFDEKKIEQLLDLEWWNMSEERLKNVNYANVEEAIFQLSK